METFTSLWYVFLFNVVLFGSTAGAFQLRNMNKLMNGDTNIKFVPVMICSGLASVSFILFVVSTILMFIQQSKA